MGKFLEDFKAFVLKGNVMSLAVGVIIGAAFQGVVSSLTDNIISPILGLFTRANFDALQLDVLGTTIRYGAFVTSVINFVIMAFVVFLLVKGMTSLMELGKKPALEAAPTTKECPRCLSAIDIRATRCPACTSELE